MFTLLIALIGAPALADAQVSFQSDMPVRFYVDGARVSSTANLKPVEMSLAAGEHQLRVETMLGRTLHDATLDVSDGESVDTRWRFRDFEVRSTGRAAEAVGAVAEVDPERAPQVFEEPEGALAIPADEVAEAAVVAPVDGEEAFEAAVPADGEAVAAPVVVAPAVGAVAEGAPTDVVGTAAPLAEAPLEVAPVEAPLTEVPVEAPSAEAPTATVPVAAPIAGVDGVASRDADAGVDGLILVGPGVVEEALGEAPVVEEGFVTGGIQLADGELHITIAQGTEVGTRTLDIAVTRDGVHVFDSEGVSYGSVDISSDLGAVSSSTPAAESEVVFVSRDGRWANLYVDGELAAYITNEGEAGLSLSPGVHMVEIRDSRGRQTWHRGALTVTPGLPLEVGFARDLSPQVMGDREAWSSQDPIGLR